MARQEIPKPSSSDGLPSRPFEGGVTGLLSGSGEPQQRVVRVDAAARCCASAFDYSFNAIRSIGDEFAQWNTGDGLAIARSIDYAIPLPLGERTPLPLREGGMPEPFLLRAAGLPPEGPNLTHLVPVGAIDNMVKYFPIQTLQLLSQLMSRLQTSLKTWVRAPEGPCLQCLMNSALPQKPQRRTRFELTHRGSDLPLGSISTRVHRRPPQRKKQ